MQQLEGPSNILSDGRLVRVEEAEGLISSRLKPTSSDSLSGGPIRNWVVKKGGTRVRGLMRIPLFLSHRHAAPVGPYNYSWIGHRLQTGLTLVFLLLLSNFKTKTSFGFLSPNYTGRVFLIFSKNLKMGLFGRF